MNNKDIIFSFGTLAHSLMVVQYLNHHSHEPSQMVFPLGHAMIVLAMYFRNNEKFREKYFERVSKFGMFGHAFLFASTLINAKFDTNGNITLPPEEKVFLAGQVAMFILYYNDLYQHNSRLAYLEKVVAYAILGGFYIHGSIYLEDKHLFVPMVAISILYVALFLMTVDDGR